MAPQPLSRVRPNAAVYATPDALRMRPNLSCFVAEIIARWAYVEANLRTILSYLLRAEAAPVAAMLNSISSATAQMDMIGAAGRAKLHDPELETFEAVLKIARTAAKKRNAIAHHVWGITHDLPDALLLIDPEAYSDLFVEIQEILANPHQHQWVILQTDNARTSVYRENDFVELIDELSVVSRCTTFLINYLNPQHAARDQMYRLLCSEPLIGAALSTLRNSRQPRPMPSPPDPQTESGSS